MTLGTERVADRVLRGLWERDILPWGVWGVLQTEAALDRLHPGQHHLPDQGVELNPHPEPPCLLPLLYLPDLPPNFHLYRPQHRHHHRSRQVYPPPPSSSSSSSSSSSFIIMRYPSLCGFLLYYFLCVCSLPLTVTSFPSRRPWLRVGCKHGVGGGPSNRCLPDLHPDLYLQKWKVADAGEIITFVLRENRGSFRIFFWRHDAMLR